MRLENYETIRYIHKPYSGITNDVNLTNKINQLIDKYADDFFKGTTAAVNFSVKYLGTIKTAQFTKAGFKLSGEINRFDYDLKWNKTLETGGLVVGDMVQIAANIELNQAK